MYDLNDGNNGWLSFASSAFGIASDGAIKLITSGQQNKTYREISLEKLDNEGDAQLAMLNNSGVNKHIVLIGVCLCVAMIVFAFAWKIAK